MCWCELFFLKKIRKGKKKTDLHLTLFFWARWPWTVEWSVTREQLGLEGCTNW
jgi:hypothetical protein